jgi:oligoribonuclease
MADRDHKYIFWIDLETTGSDLDTVNEHSGVRTRHEIIEIGAVITDMKLNVHDGRSHVIGHQIDMENVAPVVVDMHTKNGLWKDVAKSTLTIGEADNELAEWIKRFNGNDHMAFAGSGIMHFDRKFIRRDLPLLDKRITHWGLDVGVIRRTFKFLLGSEEWPEDNKSHRAIDDALFHIEEMRFALDKMRTGVV